MDKKKIIVNCPKCETEFNYYSSEARPFCSEHCKQVDLGGWLTGSYAIAGEKVRTQTDENNEDSGEILTH